jgi:endonuclease/exonuclease/phosphatase family metal-dependent hydrolase
MHRSVQLLRNHGVDVVGLQEFEITQFAAFMRDTGGAFATFPGPRMGHNPVRNSIAWRTDAWSLVAAHTQSIPYFHGHRVPMPYVLLENRATGRKVWFMNVHNPASTKSHGNNQRWRNVATGIEIATVHRLQATGLPVVFTGDFNERSEAFCRITAATALHAANGGSTSGPCHLPPNHGIDWIFGSPGVSFAGYVRQGRVHGATDHPLIVATATVGG